MEWEQEVDKKCRYAKFFLPTQIIISTLKSFHCNITKRTMYLIYKRKKQNDVLNTKQKQHVVEFMLG